MSRTKRIAYMSNLFIAITAFVLLGLVISPQAMAVVPCSVPSDRPTIQDAVNDGTCDPINVSAGVFTETGQIVINRNLTITGAGAGSTVIKKAENTGDTSSGNNRGWFLVTAGSNSFNLSGVTLDGAGKQICIAVLSFGTTTVEDSDIKNISWTPESYYGRGICLYGGSGNVVRRCTFSNIRRIGVFVFGSGISATIEGCTYVGKGVGDWLDYAFEVGGGGNSTINKCSVLNNLGVASVDGSTSAGILATTYFAAGTSATVTNSTITNCTDGIEVGYLSDDTTTLVANYNSISGNTDYGVNNVSTAVVVNAENNWWGDASGPGPVGPGTGDNVSLNVDYDPWLQIYWKDYNGPENAGGYMPDIDQNQDFDKVIVRTEETGNGVSFLGSWTVYSDQQNASGGTLKYSNDLQTPASCSFTFTGTSISWIGYKDFNLGISEVRIDGNLMATVDLYTSGSPLWKQVLYTNNNLSHGQHTITIKPTNQKNPLSQGYYTDVDAFDVDNKEHQYCAPVAEANSLWWLDKKYENIEIFANPLEGTGYIGGDINHDGSADILDLVKELATMMNTNVGHTGTTVADEQAGIDAFLAKYQLGSKLYEHTVYDPEFSYIEAEVERSQDVKLDLGFWKILVCDGGPGNGQILWQRVGGHAVTVAGVDSQNSLFAISDPDNDAAESGGLGVIRPVPGGHPLHPNDTSIHNIEANASHDIYTVVPSASPGGIWALKNYPGKVNFPTQEWGQPTPTPWPPYFYPCEVSMIITEIEAAVIVSPGVPDISVSPLSHNFGNVKVGTSSAPRIFTISNTGTTNLVISSIGMTGGNAGMFSVAKDTCLSLTPTIAPGGNCTIKATFSPTAAGAKSTTMRISSNDPDENPLDVPLSGTGALGDISVSPTSLDFKQVLVGGSSTKTVTVSNIGLVDLKIFTITIAGTNKNQFSTPVDNCSGKTVAALGSCTVDVKFSPTSTGKKTAKLSIPSDDPDSPTSVVSPLKGTGAKVVVTSPNGGETLSSGTKWNITWQTSAIVSSVAKVKLYYMLGTGIWNPIATLNGNPGSYSFNVPIFTSPIMSKVKVVLKSSTGITLGSDVSDGYFTFR